MKRKILMGALLGVMLLTLPACDSSNGTDQLGEYPYTATVDSFPGILVAATDEDTLNNFIDEVIGTSTETENKSESNSDSNQQTGDAPIQIEEAWYQFDSDRDEYEIFLRIRNISGEKIAEILPSIDVIDETGDITFSTAASFMNVLDDGQACVIDSDFIESKDVPYGIRITSLLVTDIDDNLEKIIIDPAIVIKDLSEK